MLPVGLLMTEHRLIKRMISLMARELGKIKQGQKADASFIDSALDFLVTYADKCHHGKEEDILFRDLKEKKLTPEHKRILEELIKEHALGRGNVKKLSEANDSYKRQNKKALSAMEENLAILAEFYPKHIEKEDKHFFLPVMDYFSKEEKDIMLKECHEFDQKLIHEKYRKIVSEIESNS